MAHPDGKIALQRAKRVYVEALAESPSGTSLDASIAVSTYDDYVQRASNRALGRSAFADVMTSVYVHVVRSLHRRSCHGTPPANGHIVCRVHQDVGLTIVTGLCFGLRRISLPPSQNDSDLSMKDANHHEGGVFWPPAVSVSDERRMHRILWKHVACAMPWRAPASLPVGDLPIVQFATPLAETTQLQFVDNRLLCLDAAGLLDQSTFRPLTVIASSFAPRWNWSEQLATQSGVRGRLEAASGLVVVTEHGSAGTFATLEFALAHSIPTVIVKTAAHRSLASRTGLDGELFHTRVVDTMSPDVVARAVLELEPQIRSRHEAIVQMLDLGTSGVGCAEDSFQRAMSGVMPAQFTGSFVTYERAVKARGDSGYFQSLPTEVRIELLRCIGVPIEQAAPHRLSVEQGTSPHAAVRDYETFAEIARETGLATDEFDQAWKEVLEQSLTRDAMVSAAETVPVSRSRIAGIVARIQRRHDEGLL